MPLSAHCLIGEDGPALPLQKQKRECLKLRIVFTIVIRFQINGSALVWFTRITTWKPFFARPMPVQVYGLFNLKCDYGGAVHRVSASEGLERTKRPLDRTQHNE